MATTHIPFSNNKTNLKQPLFDDTKTIYNIHSILKKQLSEDETTEQQSEINIIAKRVTVILFILVYIPVIICNLYFANTNNSCITLTNKSFNLSLYDYLYVDAGSSIALLSFITIDVLYDKDEIYLIKKIYDTFIICYKIFTFIWLVIGGCIFWVLIDNKLCDHNVYYYMYIVLIIKIIIQVINMIIYYKQMNYVNI
jgi:hypothetical protein